MQSHLMPHYAKAKGGHRATRPRVDFHWWRRVLDLGRRGFLDTGSQQAQELAPELWGTERRESYGWKLFHREERPALERNIIDTSEWARANYRYVIGQHFGLCKRYTSGHSELATLCKEFDRLCIWQIISAFRDDM